MIEVNFETEILEKLNFITDDRVYFGVFPQSVDLTSGDPKILMQTVSSTPIQNKDKFEKDSHLVVFTIIGKNYQSVKTDERLLRTEVLKIENDCIHEITYEGTEYLREPDAELHQLSMTFNVIEKDFCTD